MSDLPQVLDELLIAQVPFDGKSLAAVAVAQARTLSKEIPYNLALAATFDLLVAAKFYGNVKPENWLWCEWCGLDLYPVLNACPACVADKRFVHFVGHKPGSGTIGPATASALREILVAHYAFEKKTEIEIRQGVEPVDLAVLDLTGKRIFLAEVKASPLFTPPLAVQHKSTSLQPTGTLPLKHSKGILRNVDQHEISLLIPNSGSGFSLWKLSSGLGEPGWAEKALVKSIQKEPANFANYVKAWANMWKLYLSRDSSDPAFWMTGACGRPRQPGEGWPKQADGKPTGSISDGKTSVGMNGSFELSLAA